MKYQLDGKVLPNGKPFTHEEVTYPSNWLAKSSDEDKAALGITLVEEEVVQKGNPKYYFNGDLNLPRDLDMLKEVAVDQAKQEASVVLSNTDWYVIRKLETNVAIPGEVTAARDKARQDANQKEKAVNACNTLEELIAVETPVVGKEV